jgi:hypothetical protein
MDTWMGNNSDPVTLHKYLYANVDPVNFVDPSGNFGLGSFSAALRVAGTLARTATARTPSFLSRAATGTGNFARGASRIFSRSKSYIKRIARKCKLNGRRASGCGYAKGLAEAELKVQALVASTPNSRLRGKNRVIVVSGAFDSARGRGTAAFNGGFNVQKSAVSPVIIKKIQRRGFVVGNRFTCLVTGLRVTTGRCAEFRSARNLLRSGSKLKNVFWLPARYVDRGTSGFAQLGNSVEACAACQSLGAQ